MKTLLIRVTAKDIKEGRKNMSLSTRREPYCRFCPVALALKRATGMDWEVLPWQANCEDRTIQFRGSIEIWIMEFDKQQTAKPISFKIKVP